MTQAKVIFSVFDDLGVVQLNRPQVINALDLECVRLISKQLDFWEHDPSIRAVLFRGGGERGFCAGGDIRVLYHHALQNSPKLWHFFDEEYALDYRIHRYPKQTIALMDGVVMGGGMGIGQACTLRIVTERTRMAMPETAIGLFPDVGATYFLSRLSPAQASYIGLTGAHLGGADALRCGLADCLMPASLLTDLSAVSEMARSKKAGCSDTTKRVEPDILTAAVLAAIEHHFNASTVAEIMSSLSMESSAACQAWAAHALTDLRRHSPLMLCVTQEQLRRGRDLSLEECFRMERIMMQHCFMQGDAMEGIRALLVDKDRAPRWQYSSVDTVDTKKVAEFFLPS